MNSKPELEILADDVVCGHGATVGALDPEQVFYLQSRGMPRSEAEAMLLEAFGAEAIARVGEPESRGHSAFDDARLARPARRSGVGHDDPSEPASRAPPRTTSRRSAPIFPFFPSGPTASRSSISTTPPRRRSRARSSSA